MTLQIAFKALVKNRQTRYTGKTWHERMVQREIIKNNFHATGNLQKAKVFANTISRLPVAPMVTRHETVQPILIYSKNFLEEARQISTFQVV